MAESKKIQTVVLLGAQSAGKTALHHWLAGTFYKFADIPVKKGYHKSTPDFLSKKPLGSNISFSDTRPYKPVDKITQLCYYAHDIAIVVVDSTDATSFTAAQAILTKLRKEYANTKIVVAVTKTDLQAKQLADLESQISELKVDTVVYTSALTGDGVDALQNAIGVGPAELGRTALTTKTINPAKRYYAALATFTLLALAAVAAVVLAGLYVPGAGAFMMNIMNLGGNPDATIALWTLLDLFLPLAAVGLAELPLISENSYPSKNTIGVAVVTTVVIGFTFFFALFFTMILPLPPVGTDLIFFSAPQAIAAVAEITAMVLTPLVILASSAVHYVAKSAADKLEAPETAKPLSMVEVDSSLSQVSEPGKGAGMGPDNGSDNVLDGANRTAAPSFSLTVTATPPGLEG